MKDFSFEKVKMWIKQELVLTIALLLGCVSSFFNTPKMHYIDWDVLAVRSEEHTSELQSQ